MDAAEQTALDREFSKFPELLEIIRTTPTILKWRKLLQLPFAALCGKKISVGMETRPGWTGDLEFFIFWCRHCHKFSKDYFHSWPEMRYLMCQHCRMSIHWPERSAVLRYHLAVLWRAVRYRFSDRIS